MLESQLLMRSMSQEVCGPCQMGFLCVEMGGLDGKSWPRCSNWI